MPRKLAQHWIVLSLLAAACTASTPPVPKSAPPPVATLAKKPLPERVVPYQIDARFDAVKHTVDATETLTYRNLTGQPQDTFPFHLYLNAFQPKSTFMSEVRTGGTRGTGPEAGWDPKHNG